MGLERLFDKAFIHYTLKEAVDIVEDIDPADDLRIPVLNAAIAMVGQMRQGGCGAIAVPQVRVEPGRML